MRVNSEMMYGQAIAGMGRVMRALTVAGGMVAILATLGCSGGGSVPSQKVLPPAALQTVPVVVSGTVTDAASSAALPATVTVSGAVVYDAAGTAKTTFTSSDGVMSFNMNTVPGTPVTLDLVVTSAGYLSGSKRLEINKEGNFSFNVALVKTNGAVPAGVTTATSPATASSGGTLSAPVSLVATGTSSVPSSTQVTIPVGATLTAADGTPLSGALNAVVANFNPQQNSALSAFPGGLNNVVTATGAAPGAFLTAGFTAIEVTDASGKAAKNLSTPMTIRINIPAGTNNPVTGTAVKVGDTIPVWTYDPATGKWQAEMSGGVQVNGTVQSDANGFFVTYTTNHFSYWNLDWFMQSPCSGTINFVGADNITLDMVATGPGFLHSSIKPAKEKSLSVKNLPRGMHLQLDASFNGHNVGSLTGVDFCSTPTVDLTAKIQEVPTKFTVRVSRHCRQDSSLRTPHPSVPVFYRDASGKYTSAGTTGVDGTLIFSGPQGSTIKIKDRSGKFMEPKTKKGNNNDEDDDFDEEEECEVETGSHGGTK